MEEEKKSLLIRYIVCFCVGVGLVLAIFSIKGFSADDAKYNIQLLHDAFFSSGALLMLFSAMLYLSSEGALLGLTYVFGRALKAVFIPFGRKDEESYADYRERKLGGKKGDTGGAIFWTGLFFVIISVVFLIIWYRLS